MQRFTDLFSRLCRIRGVRLRFLALSLVSIFFATSCDQTNFSGSAGQARSVERPSKTSKEVDSNKSPDIDKSADLGKADPDGDDKNHAPQIISTPILSHNPGEITHPPQMFDLTKWRIDTYDTSCGDRSPQWNIGTDMAYQGVNAEGSTLVSDLESIGTKIEGVFSIGADASDNDMTGFVFGYQDSHHTYLFDWKEEEQGQPPGMCLQVIDYSRPIEGCELFYGRNGEDPSNFRVLECNQIPWRRGVDYKYTLDFLPGNIRIVIEEGGAEIASFSSNDTTFTSGKFGFYSYSQDQTIYMRPSFAPLRGDDYVYQVEAEDEDDDDLTFSLEERPYGMKIDEDTGEITWKAENKSSGSHKVVVVVEDSHGAQDTQTYYVTIE